MQFLNRCAWVSVSGGTASFVLASAKPGFYVPASCLAPAVIDDGTYNYFAVSSDGSQHEEGTGTWTVSTSTLTRTSLRNSSNSGSPTDFTSPPTIYMGGQVATDASISVTGVKTIQVTTGASPLVITPDENAPPLTIYEVTSGGTGTDEYIHLLTYPYTVGGFFNPQQVNKRIIFVMVAQTNPSDVVHTLLYDVTNTAIRVQVVLDASDTGIGRVDPFIGGVLNYVGAPVAYAWFYDQWFFDLQSVEWDSSTDVQFDYEFRSGYDINNGNGNDGTLQSGYAKTGSGGRGGYATLVAGAGDGAGVGGPVLVASGSGGVTGTGGAIDLTAGDGGATSGTGGDIAINSGSASGPTGGGGEINVQAGHALFGGEGLGGRINILAGGSRGAADGPPVAIVAGNAETGTGGPITLEAGKCRDIGNGGALSLTAGAGGETSGNGGDITQTAGIGGANGTGGSISQVAGNGRDAGNGGSVTINAGPAEITGNGGQINLTAGTGGSTSGHGGGIALISGIAQSIGNGGAIEILARNGGTTSGNGGDITLTPGTATSGTAGHILLSRIQDFADDAAAATGGVPLTGLYRTGSLIKIRVA